MKVAWPGFITVVHGGRMVSRGTLRPSPAHGEYRVRIEYEFGFYPKVYVEDPPLAPKEPDGRIPHVYPGPRPCLFHPDAGEWTSYMAIAETIVPWLMLWLFHYEIWLVTGVWHGGGVEHDGATAKE